MPPTAHRLYPEGPGAGKTVARLLLFDDCEELQEWVEGLDEDRLLTPNVCAIVAQEASGRLTVAFWRERMDPGTIAHEALHLALIIARQRGWLSKLDGKHGWASDEEELLAKVVDRVVVQVLRRMGRTSS